MKSFYVRFSQFFWKFNFILRIGYTNKKPCGFPKIFLFYQGIAVHLTGTLCKFRSGDGGCKGCGWLVTRFVKLNRVWQPRGLTTTPRGEGCVGRRIGVMAITAGGWPTKTGKALWRTKWPKEWEVEKWGWRPVRLLILANSLHLRGSWNSGHNIVLRPL